MTSTIVQEKAPEITPFDLESAIAGALAAHDAMVEAERARKDRAELESLARIRREITNKLSCVLNPGLLAALPLENFRTPGMAVEFKRGGTRYEIFDVRESGLGTPHRGWGICELASDGRYLSETFDDAEFEAGLLTFIGKTERRKAKAFAR